MTKIIAHRGASSIAPENTIAAAKKALELGADLWETDVAVTKDEHLILFHDTSLKRTTNVKKIFPFSNNLSIAEYSFKQISKLETGSRYIETDPFGEIKKGNLAKKDLLLFKAEKVPALEDAILYTKKQNWKVNLELKQLPEKLKDFPVVEKVVEMVKKTGIDTDQIIISSFNHEWLDNVHNIAPEIEIQALFDNTSAAYCSLNNYAFDTYNLRNTVVDEQLLKTIQKKGKKINIFTVNMMEEMKYFMAQGVDGLITDYPQLACLLKDH